jgi:hypothetical protein
MLMDEQPNYMKDLLKKAENLEGRIRGRSIGVGLTPQDAETIKRMAEYIKVLAGDLGAMKRNHFTAYQVFEAVKSLERGNPEGTSDA